MKLKLDENGNVVLEEGKPVYVYDDGSESPFDAKATLDNLKSRISNLEDEKTRHFNKVKELKAQVEVFKDIDPEKAREALETVSNLKDQQLLDSQGVKALKAEMREIFDTEKKQITDSFNETLGAKDTEIQSLNATVHDLMVTQRFHSSPFFSGDNAKTVYPPNDAARIFGHHFSVETSEGGKLRVTAKDSDGKTILSRQNHGEPAGFDEAISLIIDQHPEKARFLRSPDGNGPPSNGNTGNNEDPGGPLFGQSRIAAGLKKQYPNRF